MRNEWDTHSVDWLHVCLGDINGHLGKYIDKLNGIHGR